MTRTVQRRKPDPTPVEVQVEPEVGLTDDIPNDTSSVNCGWCMSGHCWATEKSKGCVNRQPRNPIGKACPHECPKRA